jgi:hypothetical protein
MFSHMRPRALLSLLAFSALAAPASAATISVVASDSGFYNSAGNHTAQNQNYLTGRFDTTDRRSFFVFDLSGVSKPVTAATLNLYNPDVSDFLKGYVSPDPTETLAMFDVATPIDTLTLGGLGIAGVFDDLGTGVQFGTVVVSPADNGRTVSIVFNAAGIDAINAALGGRIAFGGVLTTLGAGIASEHVFGFSTADFAGDDVRRLDLTVVPEPGTLSLLGFALVTIALRRCFRTLRPDRAVRARSAAAA